MPTNTQIRLGANRKIAPETIIMLKADANYTNVYLADGTYFLSSITLGKLAKRLAAFEFIRPNRSVLVNEKFIQNLNTKVYIDNGPSIKLLNETVIPISRRRSLVFEKNHSTIF